MNDRVPETIEEARSMIEELRSFIEILAAELDQEHLEHVLLLYEPLRTFAAVEAHKKQFPNCFVCRLIEEFGGRQFGGPWIR